MRMQAAAIEALQEALESYLVSMLTKASLISVAPGQSRQTLGAREIRLLYQIINDTHLPQYFKADSPMNMTPDKLNLWDERV